MAKSKPFVFTVDCPKKAGKVFVAEDEYKILDESGRELMVVKGSVSFENVQKAAKCAKLTKFFVRRVGSSAILGAVNFPVKSSLVVVKPVSITPAPKLISPRKDYEIIRASDGEVLRVVKGTIRKDDIVKAAKCAGFKEYTAWRYSIGGPSISVTQYMEVSHDVFLRRATPRRIVKESTKTYKTSQRKLLNTAIAALTELAKNLK